MHASARTCEEEGGLKEGMGRQKDEEIEVWGKREGEENGREEGKKEGREREKRGREMERGRGERENSRDVSAYIGMQFSLSRKTNSFYVIHQESNSRDIELRIVA